MARRIDRSCDDADARLRFHISSAGMAVGKQSYVGFQRFLDRLERSIYCCGECGWRGLGKDLMPMVADGTHDRFAADAGADSWYACPRCEAFVDPDRPQLSPVARDSG